MNEVILLLLLLCVVGAFFLWSRQSGPVVRRNGKISALLRSRHNLVAETPVWRVDQIKPHNKATDLWLIIDNKVYDVTDFVEDHEGGSAILRKAGLDNSKGFKGSQHPAKVFEMIDEYYIGDLHEDDHFEAKSKPDEKPKSS